MKTWPEDNKPAYFGDLVDPIIKALKHAYRFQRKAKKDIPWTGPPRVGSSLVSCFPYEEMLKAENLAYSMDDQGRNALEEIIGIAISLGIEQGRRVEVSDNQRYDRRGLIYALASSEGDPKELLDLIKGLTEPV